MAKAAPAFQFYAKDFLSSTALFSSAEVGVMIRAMCWSWDNGPLPLQKRTLCRILMVSDREFTRLWPVVSQKWNKTDDGYVNRRLEKERDKQARYRELQANKGRASAATRTATEIQPSLNRGSAEPVTERQPSGQPDGQPKSNSSIFDLRSVDPIEQPRSAALRPSAQEQPSDSLPHTDPVRKADRLIADIVGQMKNPTWTDAGGAVEALRDPDENPRVLTRLAHAVLDDQDAGRLAALDVKGELQDRAAKAGLVYAAGRADRALDSAEAQRVRQTPAEAALRIAEAVLRPVGTLPRDTFNGAVHIRAAETWPAETFRAWRDEVVTILWRPEWTALDPRFEAVLTGQPGKQTVSGYRWRGGQPT